MRHPPASRVAVGSDGRARDVSGFLLLDKPRGLTSNRALQKVKRLFEARKAGHTGSLDPLATGMLPICFGAATRVAQYALAADKSYEVTARLGARTDTGDADGRIVAEQAVPELEPAVVEAVLESRAGASEQTPPMYSAVKHEGKRLYELARRGLEVERAARTITIRRIELVSLSLPELTVRVTCSKGTYIRTLMSDVAEALGTIGHVVHLRRLAVDPFGAEHMWTLEALERLAETGSEALDATLRPTDSVLADWPKVVLPAEALEWFRHGRTVPLTSLSTVGPHRIYSSDGAFVGMGEADEAGELAPRRVLV